MRREWRRSAAPAFGRHFVSFDQPSAQETERFTQRGALAHQDTLALRSRPPLRAGTQRMSAAQPARPTHILTPRERTHPTSSTQPCAQQSPPQLPDDPPHKVSASIESTRTFEVVEDAVKYMEAFAQFARPPEHRHPIVKLEDMPKHVPPGRQVSSDSITSSHSSSYPRALRSAACEGRNTSTPQHISSTFERISFGSSADSSDGQKGSLPIARQPAPITRRHSIAVCAPNSFVTARVATSAPSESRTIVRRNSTSTYSISQIQPLQPQPIELPRFTTEPPTELQQQKLKLIFTEPLSSKPRERAPSPRKLISRQHSVSPTVSEVESVGSSSPKSFGRAQLMEASISAQAPASGKISLTHAVSKWWNQVEINTTKKRERQPLSNQLDAQLEASA